MNTQNNKENFLSKEDLKAHILIFKDKKKVKIVKQNSVPLKIQAQNDQKMDSSEQQLIEVANFNNEVKHYKSDNYNGYSSLNFSSLPVKNSIECSSEKD